MHARNVSSYSCVLVVFAGSAASAFEPWAETIIHELPDGSSMQVPVVSYTAEEDKESGENASPGLGLYGPRSTLVYDSLTGLFSNPTARAIGCTHVLEDCSFEPGPWASSVKRVASSWGFSFWLSRWEEPNSPGFQLRTKFYNASSFVKTPESNMIPSDATLAGDLIYVFPAGTFNAIKPDVGYLVRIVYPTNAIVSIAGNEDLKFSGSSFLVRSELRSHSGLPLNGGFNLQNRVGGVGRSPDIGLGRDANLDGVFRFPSEYRTESGTSLAFSISGSLCPCIADFDASGGTPDTSDITRYFSAWLAGDATADTNCSGGAIDAADIDSFFTQWLAGGC